MLQELLKKRSGSWRLGNTNGTSLESLLFRMFPNCFHCSSRTYCSSITPGTLRNLIRTIWDSGRRYSDRIVAKNLGAKLTADVLRTVSSLIEMHRITNAVICDYNWSAPVNTMIERFGSHHASRSGFEAWRWERRKHNVDAQILNIKRHIAGKRILSGHTY